MGAIQMLILLPSEKRKNSKNPADIIYSTQFTSNNTLLEYYTPKEAKRQAKPDIFTFFVNYDNFYVNIIM